MQLYISPAMLVLMAIMAVDAILLARKVGNMVDVKFPDNTESSLEARHLRGRPRIADAPDACPTATGQPRRQNRLTARQLQMRTLVLGGIRSGKSRWAEAGRRRVRATVGARPLPGDRTSRRLPTRPGRTRVAAHRSRRPAHWSTVESTDVATQLRAEPETATLVDDVGDWLTAAMDRRDAWAAGSVADAVDDLMEAVASVSPRRWCWSAPRSGLTVVPATEAGRRFADALGELNQRLAAVCDRVVLVVAGVAVPIKPERGP